VRKPSLSLFGLGAACAAGALLVAAADPAAQAPAAPARAVASIDKEVHLGNVRQLTFGGENAEAYFSFDGQRLSFQSTRDAGGCDQIYSMKIDGSDLTRISDGGRTTCAYYTPDGQHVTYASTVKASRSCPPVPDYSLGYVWPIYAEYDIFKANADGSNLQPLTTTPGYDAEATIRADGRIVFTSVRDGDMEIYSMNGDGSDVRRLTSREGPDGGPFYSHDGTRIVFRGRTLVAGELQDYRSLLTKALWRPTALEIFVMNADGSNLHQVTKLGAASFAPFFSPDDARIIFASNAHNPKGRDFELFIINIDGTGLERITYNDTFDGFPMFSPDGKRLVFASNRFDAKPGDTNLFLAEWKN
jgi:TolB protein